MAAFCAQVVTNARSTTTWAVGSHEGTLSGC